MKVKVTINVHWCTPEKGKNMDIEKNFTYHKPTEDQAVKYVDIRNTAKQLAIVIGACCPDSREKSLAFTKLEEAVMWANAAIARNE